MSESMELLVEPLSPQSLEFKLSEQGGVQFEQGEPLVSRGEYYGPDGSIGTGTGWWDDRGNWVWNKNTSAFGNNPRPTAPAPAPAPVVPAYTPPPRDTSRDPAWWGTGGGGAPVPSLPSYAPPVGGGGAGGSGTNPMVQLLSAQNGTTNVSKSAPLANALRAASVAQQGG